MFNKDEKYINDTFGRENHFTVPEGYFDKLGARIMQRVEDVEVCSDMQAERSKVAETVSMWTRYSKAIVSAAAGLLVCVFSLGAYLHTTNTSHNGHVAVSGHVEQVSDDSSIDAMVDYAMMDSNDMYALMADAQ